MSEFRIVIGIVLALVLALVQEVGEALAWMAAGVLLLLFAAALDGFGMLRGRREP